MKKAAVLVLLVTIFLGTVVGQGKGSNYKYRIAKSVYDELVNAFGDGRTAPEFKFIPNKEMKDSIVAAYVPGDAPVIELEELAYDVCTFFGKDSLNALACVLGHELAHYYLKHAWCSDFSNRLSHISIAAELNKVDKKEQLMKETEADYSGFYFGKVAGYKTFDIAPNLLRKLYTAYKLNPNLKGYPTLEQRVEAARQSKVLVLRRLPVFEAGTGLYKIGEYEMAFDCFNNLLADFTSRENYNNAAVCKMQIALNLFEPYEMPFCFPFELDYESRIASSSNRSGVPIENSERRKAYLSDAKKLLEESIRKDPNYIKAKLNLTICYVMLDNPDMAMGILKEIGSSDTSWSFKIMESICLSKKGEESKALVLANNITIDSTSKKIVTNNKLLFQLLADKKLRIGDDETGYQLRKLMATNSVHPEENANKENRGIIQCLKEKGKKLTIRNDSIQVSSNMYITVLKGNEEFDGAIICRNYSGDKQVRFFLFNNLNFCGLQNDDNFKTQYFNSNRITINLLQGESNFSFVAFKD